MTLIGKPIIKCHIGKRMECTRSQLRERKLKLADASVLTRRYTHVLFKYSLKRSCVNVQLRQHVG